MNSPKNPARYLRSHIIQAHQNKKSKNETQFLLLFPSAFQILRSNEINIKTQNEDTSPWNSYFLDMYQ